jgi:hypothetical protein
MKTRIPRKLKKKIKPVITFEKKISASEMKCIIKKLKKLFPEQLS